MKSHPGWWGQTFSGGGRSLQPVWERPEGGTASRGTQPCASPSLPPWSWLSGRGQGMRRKPQATLEPGWNLLLRQPQGQQRWSWERTFSKGVWLEAATPPAWGERCWQERNWGQHGRSSPTVQQRIHPPRRSWDLLEKKWKRRWKMAPATASQELLVGTAAKDEMEGVESLERMLQLWKDHQEMDLERRGVARRVTECCRSPRRPLVDIQRPQRPRALPLPSAAPPRRGGQRGKRGPWQIHPSRLSQERSHPLWAYKVHGQRSGLSPRLGKPSR